jgi:hypothetical protein
MDDQLKKFINDHNDEFNSGEPGSHVLKRIQEQLSGNGNKIKRSWRPLRWVAVVTGILFVSAISYILLEKNNKDTTDPLTDQPGNDTEEIIGIGDPVFAKQIYHFKELIGLKQNELKQLEKEYPQLYRQFIGDIDQLDSSYQSLKIKLAKNPNREMLLEAMIQNLQLQSELLNRQLLIIKEIKQKSISNEKTSI